MTTPKNEPLEEQVLAEMNARRIDGKTYVDSEWLLNEYKKEIITETLKAAVSAIEGERKPVPLIEDDEEAYHACRDFNNGLTAAITAVEEVGKNESV